MSAAVIRAFNSMSHAAINDLARDSVGHVSSDKDNLRKSSKLGTHTPFQGENTGEPRKDCLMSAFLVSIPFDFVSLLFYM